MICYEKVVEMVRLLEASNIACTCGSRFCRSFKTVAKMLRGRLKKIS